MKDWWVWSSPDLVAWTKESVLLPQDTPSPPSAWNECWATDGAQKGGAWFFYLSIGADQVAVVTSNASPSGPWQNALGVPLLNASLGASLHTTIRDPCAFQDDDGSYYIVFGTFVYYIAKLGEDMMSLAEAPRLLTVVNPTGPYGNSTDDKPFMHKRDGLYYLSWGCFWASSPSPYGPFYYNGSVISTDAIAPDFRMNQTAGPWYSHEDYADRHGSFWTAHGQWYYACNDRSHSTDAAHRDVFRDTVIGYVNYYANGSIAPVVIDAVGVGEYDAAVGIEAEHYFSIEAAHKGHDDSGRFGVHGIVAGTVLAYPRVRGWGAGSIMLSLANGGSAGGHVTARIGSATGTVLCTAALPATGAWDAYAEVPCALAIGAPPAGAAAGLDLVLTFDAAGRAADESVLAHLDAIRFRGW